MLIERPVFESTEGSTQFYKSDRRASGLSNEFYIVQVLLGLGNIGVHYVNIFMHTQSVKQILGWGIHGLDGWGIHGLDGWGIYGSNKWGTYGKVSYCFLEDMLKKTLVFRGVLFPVLT